MRILQLISTIGHYGAEAMVANLSPRLHAQGRECYVCTLTRKDRPDLGLFDRIKRLGLPVFNIACSGRSDWEAIASLRQLVREYGFNLVHSHNYKSDFYAYVATRRTQTRLVATCHNWTNTTSSLRLYARLDRMLLRRFDAIAAVSGPVAKLLVESGVSGHRVRTINNGIETSSLPDIVPLLPAANEREVTVGTVSRLVEGKGIEDLLHAAHKLLQELPDTRFLIAGDGPARQRFQELACQLGIAPRVHFLGFTSDVPAVLASMDIFALPSFNEGLPLSVLEAMAAAKPIVASNVGALPHLVTQETGALIAAGDRAALYSRLKELIENAGLRKSQGAAARQLVNNSYSAREMTSQYLNMYSEALSTSGHQEPAAELTNKRMAKGVR